MQGLLDPLVWLLGVSVSMDTFAMSMSLGLKSGRALAKDTVRVALCFAGVQTLFLWLGTLMGDVAVEFVAGTSWIVFAVLLIIGGMMIFEAMKDDEEEEIDDIIEKAERESEVERESDGVLCVPSEDGTVAAAVVGSPAARETSERSPFSWKLLLSLAVAESIDAIGIGVSLGLAQANIPPSMTAVFLMTVLFAVLGMLFGGKLGERWEKGAEIFGGIILIALGVKQVVLG